jgi:hypothetical protein
MPTKPSPPAIEREGKDRNQKSDSLIKMDGMFKFIAGFV